MFFLYDIGNVGGKDREEHHAAGGQENGEYLSRYLHGDYGGTDCCNVHASPANGCPEIFYFGIGIVFGKEHDYCGKVGE